MDLVEELKKALDKKKIEYEIIEKANGWVFYFVELLDTRYYVFISNEPDNYEYSVHLDVALVNQRSAKDVAKAIKQEIRASNKRCYGDDFMCWQDKLGWVFVVLIGVLTLFALFFGNIEEYSNTADYNNIKVEVDAHDGDYIITNLDNNVVLEVPICKIEIVETYSTEGSTSKLRIVERKTYFGSPEIHYTLYVVKEIK